MISTITLTNSGAITTSTFSAPTLNAPFAYKGGIYPGTGGTCSNQLAAGQSCKMIIEFAPADTGVTTQTLSMTYNNGYANASVATSLTGEGLAQAIISISESNPYDFGTTTVGGSITKVFTLTNAGSVSGINLAGSFTSVFNFLNGTFPGTGGTCTSTLASASSCTIVVNFQPALAMTYSGYLTLNYYDGLRTQSEKKELSGKGSLTLYEQDYLALIPQKEISLDFFTSEILSLYSSGKSSGLTIPDINRNDYEDQFTVSLQKDIHGYTFYTVIDGTKQKTLYRKPQFLGSNIYQGYNTQVLDQDLDHDGLEDILIGTYKSNGYSLNLIGFDIVSSRTGNIIARYLQ